MLTGDFAFEIISIFSLMILCEVSLRIRGFDLSEIVTPDCVDPPKSGKRSIASRLRLNAFLADVYFHRSLNEVLRTFWFIVSTNSSEFNPSHGLIGRSWNSS